MKGVVRYTILAEGADPIYINREWPLPEDYSEINFSDLFIPEAKSYLNEMEICVQKNPIRYVHPIEVIVEVRHSKKVIWSESTKR